MAAPAVVLETSLQKVATPNLNPTDTYLPSSMTIVHKQPLDKNAKCLYCPCFGGLMGVYGLSYGSVGAYACSLLTCGVLCDYFCYDTKLQPRAFAAVMENRIEYNLPFTTCCGLCIHDHVIVRHFDQFPAGMAEAKSCTPFHCCWFVECAGGIAAYSCCPGCNCCLCNSCRIFWPGLSNSGQFAASVQAAQGAFLEKNRLVAGMVRQ
jgi:hypothetical protein